MEDIISFNSEEEINVKFKQVEYGFIIDKTKGVGVRRKDAKIVSPQELKMITRYAFAEGFANRDDFEI